MCRFHFLMSYYRRRWRIEYARIEQYYERADGTYNNLNTGSGMGGNGYARNVPINTIQEREESVSVMVTVE